MSLNVEPYPSGPAGIQRSVTEVAQAIRDGRLDEDLRGWAVAALAKRGIDGRVRPAPLVQTQLQALLDELRSQTVYVADPGAAEWVQKPHVTLCLRNKCIPGGDCDDLTGAFGGAALSIGLRVYAVRVTYLEMPDGTPRQQHILVGVLGERDERYYVDPSSTKDVMDHVPFAVEEDWIDPLDMTSKLTGTTGAELATLGKPMPSRDIYYKGGYWFEFAHGMWWMYVGGKWIPGPREPAASGIPGLGQPFERDGAVWMKTPSGVEVELTGEQAKSAGLGTIFKFHTIHELSDLVNALSYQVQQLQAGFQAGLVAWTAADPQAAASFQTSLTTAAAAWIPVANQAAALVQAVKANPQANWDHTLALDGLSDAFDEVAKAYHPFVALDRTLRASSTFPSTSLPDYSGTPQPSAPDNDLTAYQLADNATQKIEQIAAKVQAGMEVAAPWVALAALGLSAYGVYRITNRR